MKKKNKRSNTRINVTTLNVEMENKKDVILIKNNFDKLSEEDIRKLIKIIEEEKQQMKDLYYAFNTPIANTRQRTFKDLVKKFFFRARDIFDLRVENVLLNLKLGRQYLGIYEYRRKKQQKKHDKNFKNLRN